MRYFFFITSEETRLNGKTEPTLRALPGQTFDDGSPVDTQLNVQAPKEAGSHPGGARFDYPIGTVFCSTILNLVKHVKNDNYSVYETNSLRTDFNVVSDDVNFQYAAPGHRNDRMNAMYLGFKVWGLQVDDEDENQSQEKNATTKHEMNKNKIHYSPAIRGRSRDPIDNWQPTYEDQVPSQSELMVSWMKKMLSDKNVKLVAVRPKVDDKTRSLFSYLFSCGENIDTIASRTRFNNIMAKEKMDVSGLSTISTGPLMWYLEKIKEEHEKGLPYSGVTKNPENAHDVVDATNIICIEMSNQTGNMQTIDNPLLDTMKKAMEMGWEIEDVINPDVLCSRETASSLLQDIANGVIPLPKKNRDYDSSPSLLDRLMSNPKFAKPDEKEGFHIDDLVWQILVCNLAAHENTLIYGPTGTGKSELVRILCEKTGTPYTFISMGNITEPSEQLVGKLDLDPATGGTKFDWADFALAIQRPGVVLLDEINRFPRHGGASLLSVLGPQRCLPAPSAKGTDVRMIPVHPECVFFATANFGTEYTDTAELDEAVKNRFMHMELDYMSLSDEINVLCRRTGISKEDANNICIIAQQIRKENRAERLEHGISTRETLLCARYVKYGFPVEQALNFIFLPIFKGGVTDNDPDCERGSVKAIIARRFNTKEKSNNEL